MLIFFRFIFILTISTFILLILFFSAGIAMRFLPNSISVFYKQIYDKDSKNEECSLDPTSEEEKSAECSMIFTFNPSEAFDFQKKTKKTFLTVNDGGTDNTIETEKETEKEKFGIINMLCTGSFSLQQLDDSLNLAKKSSLVLQEFVRKFVQNEYDL